jgi:hypothetical protein
MRERDGWENALITLSKNIMDEQQQKPILENQIIDKMDEKFF